MTQDTDQITRETALDPTRSFIVQAPAGSGKTELLTQRFLQLLCHTHKSPEEVIAITFTRKAAGEMRERILSALNLADKNNEPPEKPHQKVTWSLAKKALKRDKFLGWEIQNNPNRLRVLTIDALAGHIAKQIPLTAKLSPQLNLAENATPYYQQAVQQLILSIADNAPWSKALKTLLTHLDNQAYQLESLLIRILSKREQWLPHISGQQNNTMALRKSIEQGLQQIAVEVMQTAHELMDDDILSELLALMLFAGAYCQRHASENPIALCHNLLQLPGTKPEDLPIWQAIVTIFLTKKGEWRNNINKRQGFPATADDQYTAAEYKIVKQQLKALLLTLQENDALQNAFHEIMQCPPLTYTEKQWEIVESLIEILPILAAQLNIIFQENGKSDFVELNLAALRALGDADNPTDLALYLDHQITHLLVDEFQDTSVMQYELIEKLVTGWEPSDGRTLFLVGDPMQSIYRFRNAEVGLFLRTQQHGISQLPLHVLRLEKNFRSNPAIVNWTNHNFHQIFPQHADITSGAITHSPAIAAKTNTDSNIAWYQFLDDDGCEEANTIIKILHKINKDKPEDSMAILVRSRNQLAEIVAALHENQITFKAIEIDPLYERMEIQDLHTLTRALLHRSDRIAWLALLRAPYCGLQLEDLLSLAQNAKEHTLWQTLCHFKTLNILSKDAVTRLDRIFPPLYYAIENQGRQALSQSLKGLWLALGGPATLNDKSEKTNVAAYFKLIEQLEQDDTALTLSRINEKLYRLYAEPDANANDQLQIMTIHKAKGLEFDHVILPGLNRKTPHDSLELLMWLERPTLQGNTDLILAPMKSAAEDNDGIYQYLRRVEKIKGENETARLLYVATTRAKKSLHFIASQNTDDEDPSQLIPPKKGSFLDLLSANAPEIPDKIWQGQATENELSNNRFSQDFRRLKADWKLPKTQNKCSPYLSWDIDNNPIHKSQPIEIRPEDKTARIIGTVIHEALQYINDDKPLSYFASRLKQLGLTDNHLDIATEKVNTARVSMKNDPRGQWIISDKHSDAHNEYALTGIIDNVIHNVIIDRCFVDEDNARWIIDYKTSTPNDNDLQFFLDNEKSNYQEQLECYATLMQQMENRPVKLGLYFPLCQAWIAWSKA